MIFYHDTHQRRLASASKIALERKINRDVSTEEAPLNTFTMAEDYHQKYLLKRHDDLKQQMYRIYPRHQDLVDSTAVARLNGYAGYHGTKDQPWGPQGVF